MIKLDRKALGMLKDYLIELEYIQDMSAEDQMMVLEIVEASITFYIHNRLTYLWDEPTDLQ